MVKMKIYSQLDEQEKLIQIFNQIDTTNRVCVDIGALDGYTYSNVRYFLNEGWKGYLFDKKGNKKDIYEEYITAENVNYVFNRYGIPDEFDLLSIDIDGIDYYIWNILEYKPRVVCIEYNGQIPQNESKVIQYNPNFEHKGDTYYGSSYLATFRLGIKKGYNLVYLNALNMIFVRNDIEIKPIKLIVEQKCDGFPACSKEMKWVEEKDIRM